jgi:hypothetical protein
VIEKEAAEMRRTILLAGVLPFVSAFLGGSLALALVVPMVVDAQEARIRAESVSVIGAGTDRISLTTKWDGAGGELDLLAPDGTTRLIIGAGGITVPDPAGSGMNVVAEDGTQLARFGTGHGPLGNLPLTTQMFLNDLNGQTRIRLSVAEDGTPRIFLYDEDGAVAWSAP